MVSEGINIYYRFLIKTVCINRVKNLEAWFNDKAAQERRKEFVENFKYVFETFLKWEKD
ncbi:MAG: hypothetical protein CM15mV11_2520 [Caudoviricetes sp.]|nr:MAG: hypothetical protein CM15mV11_2520 [Caudoviricetes sp.]